MSVAATQRHKVFLQKRSASGERKMPVAVVQRVQSAVTCSLCPDQFPGAKELGLHILTAHCSGAGGQEEPAGQMDEEVEEEEDNLVIEGSPGESMEVEQAEQAFALTFGMPPLKLNLPRPPTTHEKKQKFVVYKVNDTTTKYICLVCDKMYTSRYNIRMHMNLHTGSNLHKCVFCAKTFGHKHVYDSHVRTHTGERPFSCGKCERTFGDRSNCSSHRKRCPGTGVAVLSPPESPGPGSVTIAPNVSITPIKKGGEETSYPVTFEPQIVSVTGAENFMDELTNMGYDPEEDDNDSEEMMIEPDISLDYDDIEELMDENEEGEAKSILTAQKPVSSTIFTCSFCNVKYSQQTMLLEHLTTHLDIPSSPSQDDVEQGYMVIYYTSRPKFMCLSCGKLFATAESVNLHLNIHYEDKIYACEHCDKIFGHRHVYESHRKSVHGGEGEAKRSPDYDCTYCGNSYPNLVSLDNHELNCTTRPIPITPLAVKEPEPTTPSIKISTPSTINSSINNNNNNNKTDSPEKPKKAKRPPPMLIQLNDNTEYKSPVGEDDSFILKKEAVIKKEELEAEDSSDVDWTEEESSRPRLPVLRPKPATSLLSEAAQAIFQSSAPQRPTNGSNPRAHKIVETDHGREYIPDTNSNNILHLEGIAPPPDSSERKKGYMLRPVGPGGQQRYICVECGKHYTTSYNVRMHRNIHIGKNLYTCQFCQKEFSHKHVWEVSYKFSFSFHYPSFSSFSSLFSTFSFSVSFLILSF